MGSLMEELARREATAWEEVTRVLEEPPAADPSGQDAGSGGKPGPTSPIGAITVPSWEEGADPLVLPRSYQDLLEAAEDAGRQRGPVAAAQLHRAN